MSRDLDNLGLLRGGECREMEPLMEPLAGAQSSKRKLCV